MINKPYSLLPSDLEDGSGVIDLSRDTTFSFQVTGTSPIRKIGIQICDLSGTPSDPLTYTPEYPIYYTNIDGSAKTISVAFTSAQLLSKVGDSPEQQWRVAVWEQLLEDPVYSDWVFVKLKTTPSASISTDSAVSVKQNQWQLSYTPSKTYVNKSSSDPDSVSTSIRSLRWQIFDKESESVALYDTGDVFGCVEPSYTVDGLLSGHTYFAKVHIVDQDGVETVAISSDVVVNYNQGASGIMRLVYTDEIDGISGELAYGHEIALDITSFSGESGKTTHGSDGYDIENIDGVGYVLENKTGNTISWNDILYDGSGNITTRIKFTPVPYKDGYDIMALYLDDEETSRVRYAITSDGGLVPSDDLVPTAALNPSVTSYYITAIFESMIDGSWTDISSESTAVDMFSLGADDFVYYEHTFSIYDAFFPNYNIYSNKPSINWHELKGDLSFDELGIDMIQPLSDVEIDAALSGW